MFRTQNNVGPKQTKHRQNTDSTNTPQSAWKDLLHLCVETALTSRGIKWTSLPLKVRKKRRVKKGTAFLLSKKKRRRRRRMGTMRIKRWAWSFLSPPPGRKPGFSPWCPGQIVWTWYLHRDKTAVVWMGFCNDWMILQVRNIVISITVLNIIKVQTWCF